MSDHKHERSDAKRNREAVIDAAMQVIAMEPGASMAAIAEHSGLGRTTVYRHFPNRDELVRAIFERAVNEANAATSEVIGRGLPTRETLLALGPAIIAIPDRFRFLTRIRSIGDEVILKSTLDPSQPLRHFVKSAQAQGDIDRELSTQLILSSINGLATGLATELHAGRVDTETAGRALGELMARMLLAEDGQEG